MEVRDVIRETGRYTSSFLTGLATGRLLRSIWDLYGEETPKWLKIAILAPGAIGGLYVGQCISDKVANHIDELM